jgi:hypothetical protein
LSLYVCVFLYPFMGGERGPELVAKVIERVEAHYQIQDMEMGKVYRWCPERAVVECSCGKRETFIAFRTPTCGKCGADLAAIVGEGLEARPEDEGDHPWRYLQPPTPMGGPREDDGERGRLC